MTGPLSSIQAPCPLATPPLCCLICCPQPNVSPVVASLILLPIRVTPVALGEAKTTRPGVDKDKHKAWFKSSL